MTHLIHAELLRLRSLRSSYAIPAVVLALLAAIVIGGISDSAQNGDTTPDALREPLIVGSGLLAAIVFAVFTAIHAAGDYRYRTITQRFLATPRRGRVVASKLLTHALVAGVTAAVAVGVAFALGVPTVNAKHLTLALSAGEVAAMAGQAVLAVSLFATLGAVAGLLTRSQSAAVVAVFGVFGAEKLVSVFSEQVAGYMPFGLLNSLLDIGGSTSPGVAAVSLTALTAGLAGVTALVVSRRDVA